MTALLIGAVAAYGDGCLSRQFGEKEKGLATLGIAEHFAFVSGLENGPEGFPVSTLLLTLFHVAQQLSAGGQGGKPDIEVVLLGIVLLQDTPRQEPDGANTKAFAALAVAACLVGFETEGHGLAGLEVLELQMRLSNYLAVCVLLVSLMMKNAQILEQNGQPTFFASCVEN